MFFQKQQVYPLNVCKLQCFMEMKKVFLLLFVLHFIHKEIKFWTLARWAISQFANKSDGKQEDSSSSSNATVETSDNEEKLPMYIVSELLLDEASSIRKSEMETADLYYSKQVAISSATAPPTGQSYELKKKIAEYSFILFSSLF